MTSHTLPRSSSHLMRGLLDSPIGRPLRFAGTGVAAGGLQLTLLAVLTAHGWDSLPANIAAFLTAAQFNFLLSSVVTWRDRRLTGSIRRRWLLFHASIAVMAMVNMLVFVAVRGVVPALAASTLGIAAGACGNYLAGDRLIFRQPSPLTSLGFLLAGISLAGIVVATILRLVNHAIVGGVTVFNPILTPGLHGIHIHSVGSCVGPTFASAGGHFNPVNKQHGLDNPNGPHAGDLPNISVNSSGNGDLEAVSNLFTLSAGTTSILGTANGTSIVVHSGTDDQMTDPSGNSDGRVLCGVIQAG